MGTDNDPRPPSASDARTDADDSLDTIEYRAKMLAYELSRRCEVELPDKADAIIKQYLEDERPWVLSEVEEIMERLWSCPDDVMVELRQLLDKELERSNARIAELRARND